MPLQVDGYARGRYGEGPTPRLT